MSLRFLNTLSRSLEDFTPLDPEGRTVRVYTCGPTVYNFAHIGNFRAYIFEDLLQRHLEARGFHVHRVMNLTDVDDKTIRGCRDAGIPLSAFTARFKQAFFEDLDALRIKRADHFPEATDPNHIARMIAMIAQLEAQGQAYLADDGSVYFRISRFKNYGRLAHLNLDELRPSGRIKSDEFEKESLGDFALWKAWDEQDGDVAWDSPWGRGRPGWHIECSAMAGAILGDQLDIHCGGVDNIFPHHEAEIAQTECCTGKPFVRYWLHCAHLMVDGQKMSKSLGNFYTLRDLLGKGYSGREIRFALLTVNYRLPLNFTLSGLDAARSALTRIDALVERLERESSTATAQTSSAPPTVASHLVDAFFNCLDDDLNISGAMGCLFDWLRETNRLLDTEQNPLHAREALAEWKRLNSVLRLEAEKAVIPSEVLALVEERNAARASKNWSESDRLRDAISQMGWTVKDSKDGTLVSKTSA